jgi:hypothetical protein
LAGTALLSDRYLYGVSLGRDSRHEHCFNDLAGGAGAGRMKRIILCLGIFGGLISDVNARDLGQWEAVDPAIRQWYQGRQNLRDNH